MTLCLTCNQNNSNPVTVCISAKFLNFSSRQQALGMTGCLSDSSGMCQSPSSEATGKLNASEQGHSYTFPRCTQSSIPAPHPGRGICRPTGSLRRGPGRCPRRPPPHWVITPQCLLGIRQCTDGNQGPSFLIKKETGVGGREEEGGENHSANR